MALLLATRIAAVAMGVSLVLMAALCICIIQEAGGATLVARNDCPFTVWAAVSAIGSPGGGGGGKRLERGEAWTLQVPAGTNGRFWGRTGCSFNSSGRGSCNSGDCGGLLNCEGVGELPATLFEYRFNFQSSDYYDISIVQGFNLPMSIIPSDSKCQRIDCSSNISATCPTELKVVDGCKSACAVLNTPVFCCTGAYLSNCSSTYYSQFFKNQCPQAYSYTLDDDGSTFTCPTGSNYTVVFCGAAISRGKANKFVLIITISGASIIALAFMAVGIAIYQKKLRTKRLNEGIRIKVPNSTKSRAFTIREITESTQNFNKKIGQGGFGSVFFGQLPEGRNIAVKVLSSFSIEGLHQFQNEVDLLSKIHHKNLVSLLGYCNGTKEVMLIYEHMSEGSLRDHLYGHRAESSQLNWKMRLTIALDAIQGLEYLHVGCTPKIIHRDVKTANILLDNNLNGKLADFGLSRITVDGEASYANTAVKGTIGYLDPEYFRTQMLTEKSDVYSFGVVLLEIICGRPPIKTNLSEEEINLIQWVTPYVELDENSGDIDVIIDKRLDGNYCLTSIIEVAKLAFRCLQAKPSSRPSVSEVVAQMKEAIKLENENNSPLPIAERNDIEHTGLMQASNAHPRLESIPRKMEWADNSSNLPQVGR